MTVFNVTVTVLSGNQPIQGAEVFYQTPTGFGSALTDIYGQRTFTRTVATDLPFKVWIDFEGKHYEETIEDAMQDETIAVTFQTAPIIPSPIQPLVFAGLPIGLGIFLTARR